MSCVNFINHFDYDFSKDDIIQARDSNKLLTLDLELSRLCNYCCKYCYSSAGDKLNAELSYEELCNIVDQAHSIGVQTIVLIGGGEPLLYPRLQELISYICANQINVIVFSNGSLLDREWAQFFKEHNVFPVIKANGIRPKTINWLCGNAKAYEFFVNAIQCLQEAGYTGGFGISTIICKQNYEEIIPLWRWCRENKLIPYFERLSLQGRALNYDMQITKQEMREVFEKLANIDENEYGIVWNATHPPIAGSSCNRHYYSLYIKSNGDVIPCSGIDYAVANIRDKMLQQIVLESSVIQSLRHIDTMIKGKCLTCNDKSFCYGCRGNAYQIHGDFLAEDPLCWKGE